MPLRVPRDHTAPAGIHPEGKHLSRRNGADTRRPQGPHVQQLIAGSSTARERHADDAATGTTGSRGTGNVPTGWDSRLLAPGDGRSAIADSMGLDASLRQARGALSALEADTHRDAPLHAGSDDAEVIEEVGTAVERVAAVSDDRRELHVDVVDAEAALLVLRHSRRHLGSHRLHIEVGAPQAEGEAGSQAIADGCAKHGGRARGTTAADRLGFVEEDRRSARDIGKLGHELVATRETDGHMMRSRPRQDLSRLWTLGYGLWAPQHRTAIEPFRLAVPRPAGCNVQTCCSRITCGCGGTACPAPPPTLLAPASSG